MLPYINPRSFFNGSAVKNLPIMQKVQETQVWSLGQENPLEDEMSSHFSILAWETPWTEESSRLQSMGLQSWPSEQLSMHTGKRYLSLWIQMPLEHFRQKYSFSQHIICGRLNDALLSVPCRCPHLNTQHLEINVLYMVKDILKMC